MEKSILIQQTTQTQLKDLISSSVREALESLRADLQTPKHASGKITRQQLKDEYFISFPTIRKYEKQGKLKSYRIGRRVLFDRNQVEQSLKERKFI